MFREESELFRELVGRLDSLSYSEQVSLMRHPPECVLRPFALMVAAYCDESEDKHPPLTAQAFAVSGIFGHSVNVFDLERHWRAMLTKHRLSDFHMVDCENATHGTPYEWMSRDQRDCLQRDFIGVIVNKAEVWHYATAIELEPYRARWELLERNRQYFVKPYYLAFQHQVEMIAKTLDAGGFPAGDCVAFTFDQQKEYEGKAKELYDWLLHGEHDQITYYERLGSLGFESRLKFIALQAADTFAYESRKYVREVELMKLPPRWQWQMFADSKRTQVKGITGPALDEVARMCGWV